MLALATKDDAEFTVSTIELDEPERPYALDTIARMQQRLGSDWRLFFIMGADSWAEITTWHEWKRLLKMCDQIVATRPGYELRASEVGQVIDVRRKSEEEVSMLIEESSEPRTFFTDGVVLDISATEIRSAARAGDPKKVREFVPESVAEYIEKCELYRN